MSERVKTGIFAGVGAWALCAMLLAGCGFSFGHILKTFEPPDTGIVGIEPGEKVTHTRGVRAYKDWKIQVEAQAKQWQLAGESSAEIVGIYDGILYGSFDFLLGEGSALLGAVPGGTIVGLLAGYFVRRRGDKTPDEADGLWDEAYREGEAKGRAIVTAGIAIARTRNEPELAAELERLLGEARISGGHS